MSLSRKGLTGNGTSCTAKQIDNLTYMYEPGTNKLSRVFDSTCGGTGLDVNPIINATYNGSYVTSDAKTNTNGGTNNTKAVEFKAGNYITLKPGFSYDINANSKFSAVLNPCSTNANLTNHGFKGAESSYRYDANGNLTYDSQKQLSIAYNHLNLPYRAQKDGSNKIEWQYTADGRKLQKKATTNGQVDTKNYLGNMEFTESGGTNTLEAAYHSEGRVLNNGYWEYNLKDHLGNVRIVFAESGTTGNAYIWQENHYYPFGMQMNGRWENNQTVKNDYLYNGKELNTEIGLNWSDYGFRYYDAAIGRFTGVDPISDYFAYLSTYNYASNDPILNIDLWGLQGLSINYPTNGGYDYQHSTNYMIAQARAHNEKMAPVDKVIGFLANQAADEIPVVGEIKAYREGGLLEAAIGLLPFGRKGKKIVEKVVDVADSAKDVKKVIRTFDGKQSTESITSKEAFGKAKDANGIPRSQQPDKTIKPNTPEGDAAGLDYRNVRQYEFTNSKGEKVTIRQDKPAKYNDRGHGDQGPHYNAGNSGEKLRQHHNYNP